MLNHWVGRNDLPEIWDAVLNGTPQDLVKALGDRNIHTTFIERASLLKLAVSWSNLANVKWLIFNGVNVNEEFIQHRFTLFETLLAHHNCRKSPCQCGEITNLLLDTGACISNIRWDIICHGKSAPYNVLYPIAYCAVEQGITLCPLNVRLTKISNLLEDALSRKRNAIFTLLVVINKSFPKDVVKLIIDRARSLRYDAWINKKS